MVNYLDKKSYSPLDIPNIFSSWFSTVYTVLANFYDSLIDNILEISIVEVLCHYCILTMLKCDLTSGPDSIPPILFNKCLSLNRFTICSLFL